MKSLGNNHKKCPVTLVADLLSDRWTMLIINNLLNNREMRFCEMERVLEGISTRTLTLKLQHLESQSILEKLDNGYKLTKIGMKLPVSY
jgi:DNA-binding HxlR family transcriptional regulator